MKTQQTNREESQEQQSQVRLAWTDQLVQHEAEGLPEAIKSLWDALIAANRTYQYPRYTKIRGRLAGDGTAAAAAAAGDDPDGLGLEDVRRLTLHADDAGGGAGGRVTGAS